MLKRILILLVFGITMCYSQGSLRYKCTDYFEGTIVFDQVMWKPTEKLYGLPKLIITDNKIVVKHKKTFFKNPTLLSNKLTEDGHQEILWECIDKYKNKAYVIMLKYPEMEQIYFQYESYVYGYEITKIE